MTEKPICIVCKRRRGEQLKGKCCRVCAVLTASEGTREKYGLPKPKLALIKTAPAFVATYNRAILDGKPINKIARSMGLSWQSLRNKVSELRARGYQLEASPTREEKRIKPEAPLDTTGSRVTNGHGTGKMGIYKCKCEQCLAVRAKTRAEWKAANPEKIEEYRRRQREKSAALTVELRKVRADKPL